MQQLADRFETGYQHLRRALARALGHAAPVPSSSSGRKPERPFKWIQEELGGVPEVFPAIVLGWLMLVRSGLDSRERAAIVTAAGGSLDVSLIREKLISSWEDDDLAERDGQSMFPRAYVAQLEEDDRTWLDCEEGGPIASSFAAGREHQEPREEEPDQTEANDEDIEAYLVEQYEEAEALAAIHAAQRTLRQVREARADSRLSRGFYRGGRPGGKGAGRGFPAGPCRPMPPQCGARGQMLPPSKGRKKCAKCGGARWAQDCQDRRGPRLTPGATGPPEASAKVANCRKELKFNLVASLVAEQKSGDSKCEAMFADQVIQGIVDLGCADAMGGERALDIVARMNMEKYGDARLREANLDYQPVYGFGNGGKERAYGQVKFGIAGGGMEGDIAIDGFAKDVPILVSKKVLKKLGAVVDCDTGVAVFVKLAPGIPAQLEESPDGGRCYMSLVGDLLEQSVQDLAELQNFKTICNHLSEWSRASAAACQGSDVGADERAERAVDGRAMRWGSLVREAVQLACIGAASRSCPPYSRAWSVDELKQIPKDNMFPKAETAAQIEMKGLDSMKKAQLLAKATQVGAHATPGVTYPSLKLSIRKAILQRHAPEPTDYMGFGKHGALTYQQVLSQHPTCATWCKTEVNAGSSWEMARFVSWLNEQEVVRARTMDVIMEDQLEEQEKLEAAAQEENNTN
ncbi:unnamed protein product [Prorocentrum cordatum]|uniref:Uncharacterized protein n=1 Tax=Prorocentrum cordatum TaxID=2364126 RepID=A0ABN9WMV8_9DINO|nr:unnamed protein product [Polarella glacialis]